MAGFFFLSALWTSAFAGNGEEIYDQMPDLGDQEFRMTYGYMDRVGGTLTLDSNFGLLTVDPVTSTAYLSTGSGIAEYPLGSALSAAGLNPSTLDFSTAFPGTDTSLFIINQNDDWPGVIPPCALVPCQREWDPVDSAWVYPSTLQYDFANPDPRLVQDHIAFENWRDERCDDFNESVIESSVAAGPTAAACTLDGWASELACAGGLIHQAYEVGRRNSAMTDCNSEYPGPGRWEGSNLPRNHGQ